MRRTGVRPWFPLAVLGLLTVLLGSACANTVQVKGHSMEPAIKDGEKLTVDRNAFKNGVPQRADIVLFDWEKGKKVSRVIGLPGETVTIQDGAVYVGGSKLDEPYLAPGTRTESATREFPVPANAYFVLGDNRGQSLDSRAIGAIPRESITGKVLR